MGSDLVHMNLDDSMGAVYVLILVNVGVYGWLVLTLVRLVMMVRW